MIKNSSPHKYRETSDGVRDNLFELFRKQIARFNNAKLADVRLPKNIWVTFREHPDDGRGPCVHLVHNEWEFVAELLVGAKVLLPATILSPEMLRAIPKSAVKRIRYRVYLPHYPGRSRGQA
jgi:hypothetical protein